MSSGLGDVAVQAESPAGVPELLEELASRSPPHPATQENLGTAYNSLGDHKRALACFQEAVELKGGTPDKEDLWNIAIARKNLGEVHIATPMLEQVRDAFLASQAEEECPVTVAKVRDSLAECYLAEGRSSDAVEEYDLAVRLYARHVGERSPLYGAAVNGLSQALQASGRTLEAFDSLVRAIEVQANMDAIHPTPLYEQLGRALDLHADAAEEDMRIDMCRLVPAIEAGLANLNSRGLDLDGNGGVVLQRAGQVLLMSADMEADAEQARALRQKALEVLRRAKSLLDKTMDAGEVDLSELCVVCAMQIGLAEARLAEGND